MLPLGCLVAWLLGVAPSHEIQKGVAGYPLLVTSSLRSLQVSLVTASQVRVTHLSPMGNSVTRYAVTRVTSDL
jgi:hypothetical protein